ncbi:MAG: hypothetical protein ABFS05_03845 [Bacteroidota bacterium]
MKIKHYILLLLIFAVAACKPAIDEFTPEKGNADFSSYIAVGNSLTAGYADGALYLSGQEASYPNILAKQFALAGGGEFTQPLMKDEFGFGIDGFTPVPKLVFAPKTDCMGETSLAPVRAPVDVDMSNFVSVAADGPFNNIGVPGAKTFHLLFDQYAQLNPYYARFASDPNTSVAALAASSGASFFTLWIGNNDALWYAASGGAADSMTNPVQFGYFMDLIIKSCMQDPANPAQGAVANLPSVSSTPFFTFMNTKVPYNGLFLDEDQAAGLNMLYTAYGHPEITFEAGYNTWVVENSDGSWGRMTANDLFIMTLPTDSMQCHGMGTTNPVTMAPYPIPHKYILDAAETVDVTQHIDQYNAIIYDLCISYGLAHVDMNELMEEAEAGIIVDGITISSAFVQGNLFSLDGIHVTPTGNAILANHFIEAINETYSASIPKALVSEYGAVVFP